MEDVEPVEPEPRQEAAQPKPRRSRKVEEPRAEEPAPKKRGRPKKTTVELEPAEVRFQSTRGERTFSAMKPKKETGQKEPGQYHSMHHPQPSALHRAPNPRQAAFDRILMSW